jgi:hypothetical protein
MGRATNAQSIGDWSSPRFGLDYLVKRKTSCPCWGVWQCEINWRIAVEGSEVDASGPELSGRPTGICVGNAGKWLSSQVASPKLMHLTDIRHWRVLFTSWEQDTCTNVDHLSVSHRLSTALSSLANWTCRFPTLIYILDKQENDVRRQSHSKRVVGTETQVSRKYSAIAAAHECLPNKAVGDRYCTAYSCQRINQLHQSLRYGLTHSLWGAVCCTC